MSTPESSPPLQATYDLLLRYAHGEVPLAEAVAAARALLRHPAGPHVLGMHSPDFTPEMETRLAAMWQALSEPERAG